LGIFPLRKALEIARARDLDLVEVAPNADPPVCRVLDYGKFIYERTKREREARRDQKAKAGEVKEIRLRIKTGEHDIAFKVKDIRRFVTNGHRVKVRVLFRGREVAFARLGKQLLERIAAQVEDVAVVEQPPRLESGDHPSLLMMLGPSKAKRKAKERRKSVAQD